MYKATTVLEESLIRIRWLFDEFENVIACVSGGKDSTIIYHLCLQVASEKGRLPLKVMWIDQEAEWQATVDIVREWMYHPDVEPLWYQFPFKLFNATSGSDHWLQCWDPAREKDWMHPKDPVAKTENHYGTDRFKELFGKITTTDFPNMRTAVVGGVRAEESPNRHVSLTYSPKYKWVTWGKVNNKALGHYTFYPIYDWSYMDVWKAIHEHKWPYNRIYDAQYRYGISVLDMRVSNVHHETAVDNLFYMLEVEPETYDRLTRRIAGIDMAVKLGHRDYYVRELPFMFKDWREYRDYLLVHLVTVPEWQASMLKKFAYHDVALGEEIGDEKYKRQIQAILTHDWEGVKLDNFIHNPKYWDLRRRRRQEAVHGIPTV